MEEYVEARGGNRVIKKVSITAFSQIHAAMRDAVSMHRQSSRVTSGRNSCDWYVTAAARGVESVFFYFFVFFCLAFPMTAIARPYMLSRDRSCPSRA